MSYQFVDIFCGAGGLSYGFLKNKSFELAMANDNNKDAVATYKANHPEAKIYCCDIAKLEEEKLLSFGQVDVVVGGPPCQSYSTLGKRKMDDRAILFEEYVRVLSILKPKIFIFENVVGLLSMQRGKLMQKICQSFNELGYKVAYEVLNALDFGVPQNRERVFIVGSSNRRVAFHFPQGDEVRRVTLAEAIGDLPQIESGEDGNSKKFLYGINNDFLEFVRMGDQITEHSSPKNNPKLIALMKQLKDGQCKNDLPQEMRPKSGYMNTYAKMWWNAPAPTITRNFSTPSSSRCIHPRDSRALSIREGARLQSFPDDYIFCGSDTSKRLQIGNAVPPRLSIALAKSIENFLEKFEESI